MSRRFPRSVLARGKALAAVLGLTLAASAGGCSLAPGPGEDRTMTVYFPKARSFYPESKVKVMGATSDGSRPSRTSATRSR
ncbi:hypothetical protein [Actinomadura sp. CNU-125]|uniref:hypothetical protein n=1 Tax=Actinomadura sp. CNU-125 TaxID=1904961 RepID=UPI0021CCE0C4|nr:hypothetical protein [Actinomadura sp. CNU-125]